MNKIQELYQEMSQDGYDKGYKNGLSQTKGIIEELSSLNIEQNAEIRQLKLDLKAENEACAKVCEDLFVSMWNELDVRDLCAIAIRARGK